MHSTGQHSTYTTWPSDWKLVELELWKAGLRAQNGTPYQVSLLKPSFPARNKQLTWAFVRHTKLYRVVCGCQCTAVDFTTKFRPSEEFFLFTYIPQPGCSITRTCHNVTTPLHNGCVKNGCWQNTRFVFNAQSTIKLYQCERQKSEFPMTFQY